MLFRSTSNLLSNGAAPKDVQELLGHSDVSITMNVYAQCDIVSSANCKMVIIYENGFNASRYEYFSLRKMGLNDSVEEFVFDNDTVENIVNVF